MMIRPWILLAHRRLLWTFAVALFFTMVFYLAISEEGPWNLGVFWHGGCDCKPVPWDLKLLLDLPFTASVVGFLMGFTLPSFEAASVGVPAAKFNTLFLLTRPVSRATALLVPMAIALAAIAIFPALALGLLIGWLRLVHAPSLGHLVAVLQQYPGTAALGDHPGLGRLLGSLDLPRRYVASIVLGLCAYVVMAAQRWLVISPNNRVRFLALVPALMCFFPIWNFLGARFAQVLLMSAGRGSAMTYLPSTMNIALHLALACGVVAGCLWVQRTVEN